MSSAAPVGVGLSRDPLVRRVCQGCRACTVWEDMTVSVERRATSASGERPDLRVS